jgi:hypothetical protein
MVPCCLRDGNQGDGSFIEMLKRGVHHAVLCCAVLSGFVSTYGVSSTSSKGGRRGKTAGNKHDHQKRQHGDVHWFDIGKTGTTAYYTKP